MNTKKHKAPRRLKRPENRKGGRGGEQTAATADEADVSESLKHKANGSGIEVADADLAVDEDVTAETLIPLKRREHSAGSLPGWRSFSGGKAVLVLAGIAVLALAHFLGRQSDSTEAPFSKAPKVETAETSPSPIKTNSLGMELVAIPGSSVHMGRHEVRRGEFNAFCDAQPGNAPGEMLSLIEFDIGEGGATWATAGFKWDQAEFEQTDAHPVVGVSYQDAQRFCQWLTEKERDQNGLDQVYRMPTVKEWRQAFATESRYPWGDEWSDLFHKRDLANLGGAEVREGVWPQGFRVIASYRDAFQRTAPAGTFEANALNICDMLGNVAEWCCDPASDGNHQPVLGGSWSTTFSKELDLNRAPERLPTNARTSRVGFRVVLAP